MIEEPENVSYGQYTPRTRKIYQKRDKVFSIPSPERLQHLSKWSKEERDRFFEGEWMIGFADTVDKLENDPKALRSYKEGVLQFERNTLRTKQEATTVHGRKISKKSTRLCFTNRQHLVRPKPHVMLPLETVIKEYLKTAAEDSITSKLASTSSKHQTKGSNDKIHERLLKVVAESAENIEVDSDSHYSKSENRRNTLELKAAQEELVQA